MQWEAIAGIVLPGLAAVGGGVRWLLSWYLGRQETHDNLMLSRQEAMQDRFFKALDAIEEKLERHRLEHLTDTKAYAQSLAEVTRALQKRDSSRPSPGSTGPTNR